MFPFLCVAGLLASNLLGQKSCPVTKPFDPPFIPPAPYVANADPGMFWHGDKDLWTLLPVNGMWHALPYRENEGYFNKLFLWKPGFDGRKEEQPDITVVVRPLDGHAPPVTSRYGTNAFIDPRWAMLTGLTFPAAGCWEVTASNGGHKLTFVVSVQP
jgi:hypothetical protein